LGTELQNCDSRTSSDTWRCNRNVRCGSLIFGGKCDDTSGHGMDSRRRRQRLRRDASTSGFAKLDVAGSDPLGVGWGAGHSTVGRTGPQGTAKSAGYGSTRFEFAARGRLRHSVVHTIEPGIRANCGPGLHIVRFGHGTTKVIRAGCRWIFSEALRFDGLRTPSGRDSTGSTVSIGKDEAKASFPGIFVALIGPASGVVVFSFQTG